MIKKILVLIYKYVPSKFKGKILQKIVKLEGGQMYSETLRHIFKTKYKIEIGYGSYGGCFNIENNIPKNVTFGNWCSIANNIRIFRANHPKSSFTTHPLLYNPSAGYVDKDALERPALKIGHDVWIGEWAIILPSVKVIGNGAIIGAGTVVTKDVEPYSIVVGNPSKIIGRRFEKGICENLENSEWWKLKREELVSKIDSLASMTISS